MLEQTQVYQTLRHWQKHWRCAEHFESDRHARAKFHQFCCEQGGLGLRHNLLPRVTPYYKTAAEMLLLQLDMLAHVDERPAKPTIVIGAGIPTAWLDRPMSVRNLSTPYGEVDWDWNGKEMRARIRGGRLDVRLGKPFASETRLHVEYVGS